MGREIKRVSLKFNWPLGECWAGYLSPSDGTQECYSCRINGRSTGYSVLGMALYSLSEYNADYKILPSDSNQLKDAERNFMKALHTTLHPDESALHKTHYGPDYLPYVYGGGRSQVTDARTLMYDIMKYLAQSLNLPMEETFLCRECKGMGRVIVNPSQHAIAEAWVATEPPAGEGWQVWETVSEGSPITPVFATAEELVTHLCTKGTKWSSDRYSRAAAEAFVKSGWVPSAVMTSDGVMYKDIESAVLQNPGAGE